jgi:ABC-type spermidine/putrescine transport system permease subunit II
MLLPLLIVVLLLVPAVVIMVLSLSGESILRFPPRNWSIEQYRSLFGSNYWLTAIRTSFIVAIPTAILCLLIGVPAAWALHRTRVPFKGAFTALGLAPLVLPAVAYAVAIYAYFSDLRLIGNIFGLILIHVAISLPFAILIVGAALRRLPAELELVAMSLGAPRWRAVLGITVRLLAPAMGATFIFCFIHSFDEATFINFVAGSQLTTLPKAIFDSMRTGLEPLINAIATLLMVATAVLMTVAVYWRGTHDKR